MVDFYDVTITYESGKKTTYLNCVVSDDAEVMPNAFIFTTNKTTIHIIPLYKVLDIKLEVSK